ncbi:MAG: LTA synthase family protein, partial [Bacteroides sp.]
WLFRSTAIYFTVFYAFAFIVEAANIPYFKYFFKNINSSIYNWFDYGGTTAGMMFGETSYYLPIALGILSIVLFRIGVHRQSTSFFEFSKEVSGKMTWTKRTIIFFTGGICIGLCMLGIRGRMGYNPIKVSQAYYCDDPFLNQIGVNPVFNLLTSTLDDNRKENQSIYLMPEKKALAHVQKELGRKGIENISPIARKVEAKASSLPPKNVVLIFMESMSAHLMSSFGQTKTLTPYLDNLYRQSLSFSHFYSAGIHTNHGMYSTLYSFPSIMKRNAMKGSVIPIYSGLPTVLKDNGYQTLFFMTHESQYDNMNAFLRTNGFDEIYAQENYPSDKVVNSFGVQDDFLYKYALPVLNARAKTGKPFFSVLLSISNHPPYVIPSYFHPKSKEIEDQIVEYADWSINQFMTEARKQPWFDNTLFVFVGDHGKMVGNPDCEMPQSYNHVPLIIHGKDISPRVNDDLGGQIDIAPTLLGLLNISYVQNNFGIDLLKEKRPCMFFTADNMIGARDKSHFYIYSPESKQEFCYRIIDGSLHPSPNESHFYQLKDYCFSMLQETEYLVKHHQTIDHVTKLAK